MAGPGAGGAGVACLAIQILGRAGPAGRRPRQRQVSPRPFFACTCFLQEPPKDLEQSGRRCQEEIAGSTSRNLPKYNFTVQCHFLKIYVYMKP